MYDPDQVINYLQGLGASNIKYSARSDQIRSTCPFHGGDNPTALVVDLNTGKMFCFSCGHSSDINVNPVSKQRPYKKNVVNLSIVAEAILEEMHLRFDHRRLRSKNIEVLQKCQAGVATNGAYAGRTIFVYRDSNSTLHGFKSRGVYKPDMLVDNYYMMSSIFYLEHLWTSYYPCIIVEGEWDAIRLYELGICNVLALGGSSMTRARIENLINKTSHVYLALDNDIPGRHSTNKIAQQLNGLVNVYDIPYATKDPAMIQTKSEFMKSMKNARRL